MNIETENTKKNFVKNSKFIVTKANFIYVLFFFFLLGGLSGFLIQKTITYSAEKNDIPEMSLFWEVWEKLEESYPFPVEGLTSEEKIYSAIQGLAEAYDDPHTVFLSPEETAEFDQDVFKGEFGGVGIEVGIKNGMLVVVAPLKDSPADLAGIKSGDIIYKIDGEEASNMTIAEAIDNIRGVIATPVTLTVIRQSESEPLEITMNRDIIKIPNVEMTTEQNGITRISLFNFNEPAMVDLNKAINQFIASGNTKLILDLRNNPGGILESGVEVASYFLPPGKVVLFEDFGEKSSQQNKKILSTGRNISRFFPDNNLEIVVLINEGSASASEIVAGALQYHQVAKVIGANSFGKGSVQQFINLGDSKSALKVTVARWLIPSGESIEGQGIKPDFEVKPTKEDYDNGTDPALQAAIDYLTNGEVTQL